MTLCGGSETQTGAVSVRRATPADFPALGRILWAAFSDKIRLFVGDCPERGARLLADLLAEGALAPESARVATGAAGDPLGVCILRLPEASYASAAPTLRVALRHFGPLRGLWAFAGLSLFDERARPDTCVVALLAVAPEARGRGIGTRLLAAAEEEARAQGVSRLALDVIEGNLARNLYLRCGFRPVRTYRMPAVFARVFGYCAYDHMEKPLK